MSELTADDYMQIIGQLSADNSQLRLANLELSVRLGKHEGESSDGSDSQ